LLHFHRAREGKPLDCARRGDCGEAVNKPGEAEFWEAQKSAQEVGLAQYSDPDLCEIIEKIRKGECADKRRQVRDGLLKVRLDGTAYSLHAAINLHYRVFYIPVNLKVRKVVSQFWVKLPKTSE
jgi:hypothetical protein